MTDEQQIAALREEIRRAGEDTRNLRHVTAGCLAAPVFLLATLVTLMALQLRAWEGALLWLVLAAAFAVIVYLVIASPVAAIGRFGRGRRLRRRLRDLPQEARADVLAPLRDAKLGDTRKIAARLRRDLDLPAELAPVAAPNAQGNESSPAESPVQRG